MAAKNTVNKELTRDMIMDAARALFVEEGYQQVSMRKIAKELNRSHGAIYYHFKNKAALFYALVSKHFQELDRKIDEVVTKKLDNTEKLRQILLGYIEFGLTNQSHYEIMFLVKDDEVRNFINEDPMKTYEHFANHITALSEKQLSIREVWSIFLGLHGFVSHYLRHVVDFDEVKDAALFHIDLLLEWTKNEGG